MEKYYWSFDRDQEIYTHGADSIECCIKEAREYDEFEVEAFKHEKRKVVYIGETQVYAMPVVDSETIFENFRECAADDCGEASEDWLFNHSNEQQAELDEKLTKVVSDWIKETGQEPTFCTFKHISTYDLETGLEVLNE